MTRKSKESGQVLVIRAKHSQGHHPKVELHWQSHHRPGMSVLLRVLPWANSDERVATSCFIHFYRFHP